MKTLNKEKSHIIFVDMQDKLTPAIIDIEVVTKNCIKIAKLARLLSIGTTKTEQYPRGLESTVTQLNNELSHSVEFDKTHFSCVADSKIYAHLVALKERGITQIVLCGIEAHICILQTAIQLQELGFTVYVVSDSTGSRNPLNHEIAYQRMRQSGVSIVNTEMVIYEFLQKSGTKEFKEALKLVKEEI